VAEHFDLDRHRPYPELVEPRPRAVPYRIRDAGREPALAAAGAVDIGGRRMWVPLASDNRSVTRHELAHVAWSPRRLPPLRFDPAVLLAVEDARVNLGLRALGLPVVLDPEAEALVWMLTARDAKAGDAFALFVRAVASLGTSAEPVLAGLVLAEGGPLGRPIHAWTERTARALRDAAERAARPVAPFRVALALARELAHELRAFGLLDAQGRARTRAALVACLGHRDDDAGAPGLRLPGARGAARDPEDALVPPGRLVVRRAPLEVALRARGGTRGWRAATEGSVVRYVHRFATDRAIFRRRAYVRGGTLLVDTSGSMHLDPEQLDRFLLRTPAGTRVAIYSGAREEGELRIVAEGGRRAAPAHLARYGAGNVVDLPALEWLARQRAPRVWVTDGGVTGVGDRPSRDLRTRCRAVRGRAGIRRVATLDEAAGLFGAW
jgi:hypothetical protein